MLVKKIRSAPVSDLTLWELDEFLTSSGGCSQVSCMHACKCRRSETRLMPQADVTCRIGKLSQFRCFYPRMHMLCETTQCMLDLKHSYCVPMVWQTPMSAPGTTSAVPMPTATTPSEATPVPVAQGIRSRVLQVAPALVRHLFVWKLFLFFLSQL